MTTNVEELKAEREKNMDDFSISKVLRTKQLAVLFLAYIWIIYKEGKRGVRGHFCMFGSFESTFYRWTAAFYGTKILRRVKKLLTFEGQSSDNFPYWNI